MIVQEVVSQCTQYEPHTPTADDRPSLLPNNEEECNEGGYLSCTRRVEAMILVESSNLSDAIHRAVGR